MSELIDFDLLLSYDEKLKESASVWQKLKEYSVGDIVHYKGYWLKCKTAGTSGFDTLDFSEISNGELEDGTVVWEIVDPFTSGGSGGNNTNSGSNGVYEDREVIWEGSYNTSNQSNSSFTNTLELPKSIENYNQLEITITADSNEYGTDKAICLVDVNDIEYGKTNTRLQCFGTTNHYGSMNIGFVDSTHLAITYKDYTTWSGVAITKIVGIKYEKPKTIVNSGMVYDTLWEGEAGSLSENGSTTINLNESVSRYKKIGLTIKTKPGQEICIYYREFDVDNYLKFVNGTLVANSFGFYQGYGNFTDYIEIDSGGSNTQLSIAYGKSVITKVVGISEGVQIPTGVQAARVELWSGSLSTVNSPQTLSDNIYNYDQLEFTFNGRADSGSDDIVVSVFNTSDIIGYNRQVGRLISFALSGSYTTASISFDSSTSFYCGYFATTGWSIPIITKVVGIKYIQPDSYSTEEKLIGTWIDGKPLYRKVFIGTAPSSANVNTNIFTDPLFTNVDMCYVKDGYIKRDAGSGDIDFYKINESMDSDYRSRIFISCSESSIRGAVGPQFTSRPLVVIVEYTKN